MCVLSIKVPIRKKPGNLFNDPHIYIYIYTFRKLQTYMYMYTYTLTYIYIHIYIYNDICLKKTFLFV